MSSIPCRNIQQFGFCKFKSTCHFYHPEPTPQAFNPIPLEITIHNYQQLLQLDLPSSNQLGLTNVSYQANSNVFLKRIVNLPSVDQSRVNGIERWQQLKHPNIVSIREAFSTRSFNDLSLIIAYDFIPNVSSLSTTYLIPKRHVSQKIMWSIVIQITAALHHLHEKKLAIRNLDSARILMDSTDRIYITSCGMIDLLIGTDDSIFPELKYQDLISFGKLILTLGCRNVNASSLNLDTLTRFYSADLSNIVAYLISSEPEKSVSYILGILGTRLLTHIDSIQQTSDQINQNLILQLENDRLFRLICKLGFINERPEYQNDPQWSETGDRYMVKLFRDYVFHGVDPDNYALLDLSHVVYNLNKIDSWSEDKILLMSRDEKTCLIVSYREIAQCIFNSYNELQGAREIVESQINVTS